MAESGEWFSPRAQSETLTSEDPPVRGDKYAAPRGRKPAAPETSTLADRIVDPFLRVGAFVPELGRKIIRVAGEPSRLQLVAMWTTGSAVVAATGLAVAAVLGGAPPALTQQLDRLSVLPGLNEHTSGDPAPAADKADPARRTSARPADSATDSATGTRERTSAEVSRSSYSGYSGIPGVPAGASIPDGVVIPGLPSTPSGASESSSGSTGGVSSPTKPGTPTGGSTTPAPGNPPPAENPTDPAPPVENPTDPAPPVENPTDPAPPVENPTDPAPPVENPTDPVPPPDTPTDPPPDTPPADAPADPAPASNADAGTPTDTAPAPVVVPDPQGTTTP